MRKQLIIEKEFIRIIKDWIVYNIMIVQFSEIALTNIDQTIQIIDSIHDNAMFEKQQVLITT